MNSPELRPVSAADDGILFEIYAGSRLEEMEMVPWDEAAKQGFLQMQFAAQQSHYQAYFPRASHDVILAEGVPVGRLYVDRRETEIRILDIALLPAARGGGIGSHLLRDLMKEAEAAKKTQWRKTRFWASLEPRESRSKHAQSYIKSRTGYVHAK